ncbi:MAG: class II fructose-bisphosphate aldolase [Bacilli bacterium]
MEAVDETETAKMAKIRERGERQLPLASGKIVREAWERGYAVPAFSVHATDMIDGVLEEAELLGAPVLLQIGQRVIRNGRMQGLIAHIERVTGDCGIPAAIHLDHSHEVSQVVQALRAGVTSCMIDASSLSFEQNIEMTRQVVDLCHWVDVPVEGELGTISGVEDDVAVSESSAAFTDPDLAAEFVAYTGVDSLAVAIGSAHGMYKREPRLDLVRLQKIREAVSVPLVLHGGSGIPIEAVRGAVRLGIAKINFDTELRIAFATGLQDGGARFGDDPFAALQEAKLRLRKTVREKIACCGTAQTYGSR